MRNNSILRQHCFSIYLLILFFFVQQVDASRAKPTRIIDLTVAKSIYYSFTDTGVDLARTASMFPASQNISSLSPGTVVGITYYDQQHNGSIGRMIGAGIHGTPDSMRTHFSWSYMNQGKYLARSYMYGYYDFSSGAFSDTIRMQDIVFWAGYVGLRVYGKNRVIIGGHNRDGTELTAPHFYWTPPVGVDFSSRYEERLPDSLMDQTLGIGKITIWPKFSYVEGVTDTVLHVIAQLPELNPGDPQTIVYYRRLGGPHSGAVWDIIPYVVDTIYTSSHDIDANPSGKVAISWTANLPCSPLDDDTLSGLECRTYTRSDNDLYYQISNDFGVTWNPRVNLTNNRLTEGVEDGWRPFGDLSVLLDQDDGELHIAWGARFWPADANSGGIADSKRNKLFHWSENAPYIREIHSSDWDQPNCNGGRWQLNSAKMTISQCNGKHYLLFVQFNDLPAGVTDDCAQPTNPSYPDGAANGDLYLSISSDGGVTWDVARNLTNSRTPGCDSVGGTGGPCESDNWPSMSPYGINTAFNLSDPNISIIVPNGSVQNDWFLDVEYINDHSAGSIVQYEGFWQQADVRWFRLSCVDPVPFIDSLHISLDSISYPAWGMHGTQVDTFLTLTNPGNQAISYSLTIEELTGPTGWLGVTGATGSIDAGINNSEQIVLNLNNTGVVNTPGSIISLVGRIIIVSNANSSPDTIPVSFLVTDNLVAPSFDTISTSCISLMIKNDGSFGKEGIGSVNMDWVDNGDCDSTANIYLYSASPVIGWISGVDTIMNWSAYNATAGTPIGFVPLTSGALNQTADYQTYSSLFTTYDTSIALRQTLYAPTSIDSCSFIIKELEIYSNDDLPHSGIVVGEVIDWDIPSDSSNRNGSGFDISRNLIYQYGAEYHQDDTGVNPACQDNDIRYGGLRFLKMQKRSSTVDDLGDPFKAYTENNGTYVYETNYGFRPSELYGNMTTSTGFSSWSTTYPDSSFIDLHTGMSFVTDYTVQPGETLVIYSAYMTTMNGGLVEIQTTADKANTWFCDMFSLCNLSCCTNRGNVNDIIGPGGSVDVSDLTYLVNFLFKGGPPPICEEEGNINNIIGPGGPVDVSDLTYLVNFLFKGGPEPPPC